MPRQYTRGTPSVRFWKFVNKNAENGCWLWKGSKDGLGYGRFNPGGRAAPVLVHRYAWFLVCGKQAPDCLLHKCDNPSCVNPDHLFEGTRTDNVIDMITKGRMPRGEKRGHAKLNGNDVLRILVRLKAGDHPVLIADDYGVSRSLIEGIRDGKRWKHIPRE